MTKVYNLATNEELHFSLGTSPIWMVAYGYCTDHNLMSWLFAHQDNLNHIQEKLNIKTSKSGLSTSCDNWATLIK